MSNARFFSAASTITLLSGIVLVLGGGAAMLEASLTSPGSTVLEKPVKTAESMLMPSHGTAIAAQPLLEQAATQMFLGMLLIILGLLFYTLRRLHEPPSRLSATKDERPVPVRVRRRNRPSLFWMEIRI